MRTVQWQDGSVVTIDTRSLPDRVEWMTLEDEQSVAAAIGGLAVRGAPAIGAVAAFGLALALQRDESHDPSELMGTAGVAARLLRSARPTAVNLGWALDRVLARLEREHDAGADAPALRAAALAEAQAIADEDVEANRRMGALGAALLPEACTLLHHCNTGALATVGWGTALGVVRAAHEQAKAVHVFVCETRPLLQGARLTTHELQQLGIEHTLIVDSAAGHFMNQRRIDAVLVGADRIAANGDTANKIGTYGLAALAKVNEVPFYVVAPTATVDLSAADGSRIPVEERPADEVTHFAGRSIAPPGTRAANPAFDVTPGTYITAFVTEAGVIRPPFAQGLRAAVAAARPTVGHPDTGASPS